MTTMRLWWLFITLTTVRGEEDCSEQSIATIAPDAPALIIVDDVEDRLDSASSLCTSSSAVVVDDSVVSTQALGADVITRGSTGTCTLRAALLLAGKLPGTTTIALRTGRFRLAAPLPEVQGSVRLVGSAGRTRSMTATLDEGKGGTLSERTTNGDAQGSLPHDEQLRMDAADDADLEYREKLPGPAVPIGTTLDGDELHQVLRVGRAAKLEVRTVRLENGVAHGGSEDGGRSLAGGAINSLGELRMWNVVVRDNSADDGGALYVEGPTTVELGLLERNMARRCGGFIYAAHGSQTHLSHCEIRYNHDSCGKAHFASHTQGAGALPGPGGRPLLGGAGSAAAALPGGPGPQGGGPGVSDVSGVVAEGPSLLREQEERWQQSVGKEPLPEVDEDSARLPQRE